MYNSSQILFYTCTYINRSFEECRVFVYLQRFLVKEGLVWVDDQAGSERQYWFPSLYTASLSAAT